jgi:Fic family protein
LVDVRRADAAYKPFAAFADWSKDLTVDRSRLDRYSAQLEALKTETARSPALLARSLEIVKRAAALDTGAIEGLYETDRGFTFTVAMEAAYWQSALQEKGPAVPALFASQLGAYDFVLDLATQRTPIAEAWIRTLHERLCSAQETYKVWTEIGPEDQPLPKGQYKHHPNHVLRRDDKMHAYAPVEMTPPEMHRFSEELRSADFATAHPALQAAYSHYAFVVVHPFADGNGRVARALASVFTYRAYSIPLLVLSDSRKGYLSALEAADAGDAQPFVGFIVERILDGIRMAEDSLRTATRQTPEEALAALRELYVTRGGYSQQEVNDGGEKLLALFQQEVEQRTGGMSVEGVVGIVVESGRGRRHSVTNPAYRAPGDHPGHVTVKARTVPPVSAAAEHTFVVEVPKDCGNEDDVVLIDLAGADRFEARLSELLPVPSVGVQLRVRLFVDRMLATILEQVRADAARQMNR